MQPLGLSANQWQFLLSPDRYVEAAKNGGSRPLAPESTRRQFLTAYDILARLNGSHGQDARRGVLLADDVGLGKTTVASLVAWVIASAGTKRTVRILVPNDVMMRRWNEELESLVALLGECAPSLSANGKQIKKTGARLVASSIQVLKHSHAQLDGSLRCDLLIVDEAHRAKGQGSSFSAALKNKARLAKRILILTATPFSIRLTELNSMLDLIGAHGVRGPVTAYSSALDRLYSPNPTQSPESAGASLAKKAAAAVNALGPFVIRHGINDLPNEQAAFGQICDWPIDVPAASASELELMLRMDRMLRLKHDADQTPAMHTNDARFHVGWRHFDDVRARVVEDLPELPQTTRAFITQQLKAITQLRKATGTHAKIAAVTATVKATVESGEKVVLFCHHHATAQELILHLGKSIPALTPPRTVAVTVWRAAWESLLLLSDEIGSGASLRSNFIDWLCSDLIRTQVWEWLGSAPRSIVSLKNAIATSTCRHPKNTETVAAAAQNLFDVLLRSKSSKAVLRAASPDNRDQLPGGDGTSRVLGFCEPTDSKTEQHLFNHHTQPDTAIAIFNSPFGPDVLVVTDKLSEGIDLHRCCRHLVHYELDASPMRTMQRNGRIRRVNSWAAVTGEPIRYAYPAFGGTRDHRLVQIMKNRIDSFSLLLGGAHDFDVEQQNDDDERWRNTVMEHARKKLMQSAGGLRASVHVPAKEARQKPEL
ncbi:helicase domain protein [Oxalobacteraceae bacterium IMCC9480]|nr:helicase domain protein [Oxalobacteraceae bacterium IMCC9480]